MRNLSVWLGSWTQVMLEVAHVEMLIDASHHLEAQYSAVPDFASKRLAIVLQLKAVHQR